MKISLSEMNVADCWIVEYTKKKKQLYKEAEQITSFRRRVAKLFKALTDWLKENPPPPAMSFKDNSILKAQLECKFELASLDDEYTDLYRKFMQTEPSLPHFCKAFEEPKKHKARASKHPIRYIQNDTAEIQSTLGSSDDVEQVERVNEARKSKRPFENGASPNDGHPEKQARTTHDDALERFLKEGASLRDKTASEISALKSLVEAKSIEELQNSSVEALGAYYRILRRAKPPECFGVSELAKLCISWVCKRKDPRCLWECSYIRLLRDQREVDTDAQRKQLESFLPVARCKREACCIDPGFCPGCNCILCKGPIQSKLPWSYISCRKCVHVSHVECALSERKAGVVPENDLDMEALCEACSHKTDLVSFWKMRIKEGLSTGDRELFEKHLSVATRIAEGTKRVYFQPLLAKVKGLKNLQEHPELVQTLRELVDSIQEYDDRLLDEAVVAEILEAGERVHLDVKREEMKVTELQKKAELEYSVWMRAEEVAEARRLLLKQMKEELEKVENEAKLGRDSAAASLAEFQKVERRVRLLQMLKKTNGISSKVVELQRWNCDQELAELESLQKRIGEAKVDNWPMLYKALKAQDQRLSAAQSRLKQLSCLQKHLEDS